MPAELDLTRLTNRQVEYQKLGIAPWYDHQKPPVQFRKLWLARLVSDFYQWEKLLSQQYPDFYLAVWLCEPRFGESQLVAAVAERQRHYETLFGEGRPFRTVPARALPPEYQDLPGVADLQWTAYADIEALLPEDFAARGASAAGRPHWECETLNGARYFAVQVGWIWVGRRPRHPAC